MERLFSKKSIRLSLYFFMPVFCASLVLGLGLSIIEASNRLLPHPFTGAAISSYRQEIEYLRWYIKTATLAGAVIAVIIGFVVAFALNRPLKRLEGALKKITTGDIEELNIDTINEFAAISRSFNDAVMTIKERLFAVKDKVSNEAAEGIERMERLAVLGGISAVIAHEIRNPLASVKGLTQLMAEKAEEGSDAQRYTGVMLEEIGRLDKVADNLLYIARPAKNEYRRFDIRSLLERISNTALQAANKDVRIIRDHDKAPIEIFMDEDRLGRAFLNLLVNAIHASPQGGDVRQTVSLRHHAGDRKEQKAISVRISNKGSFIPPEDRERIFEPFFSTKGKGSGLGLAVAKYIICSHGGDIKVESDRGETSFIVELPLNRSQN